MLTIKSEAVIEAGAASVWAAWKPNFPLRPPEEESRNLDLYDLGGGFKVPVRLVDVSDLRSWTVEHALPGGKLVIEHWLTALEDGRTRVGKRFDVHGPMSLVYRLFLAGRIRRSLPDAFAALQRDADSLNHRPVETAE